MFCSKCGRQNPAGLEILPVLRSASAAGQRICRERGVPAATASEGGKAGGGLSG